MQLRSNMCFLALNWYVIADFVEKQRAKAGIPGIIA